MSGVRLDLNNPVFQRQWFALEKEDRLAVLSSLEKLAQMNWPTLCRDRGFRWELIHSRRDPAGGRLYSLRIARKMRAVARRVDDWLELLSLHPDHDSAY